MNKEDQKNRYTPILLIFIKSYHCAYNIIVMICIAVFNSARTLALPLVFRSFAILPPFFRSNVRKIIPFNKNRTLSSAVLFILLHESFYKSLNSCVFRAALTINIPLPGRARFRGLDTTLLSACQGITTFSCGYQVHFRATWQTAERLTSAPFKQRTISLQ